MMDCAKRLGVIAGVWGVLLAATVLGQEAGKVSLRLRLKQGDVYAVKQTTEQKIVQEVQGQEIMVAQSFEPLAKPHTGQWFGPLTHCFIAA